MLAVRTIGILFVLSSVASAAPINDSKRKRPARTGGSPSTTCTPAGGTNSNAVFAAGTLSASPEKVNWLVTPSVSFDGHRPNRPVGSGSDPERRNTLLQPLRHAGQLTGPARIAAPLQPA